MASAHPAVRQGDSGQSQDPIERRDVSPDDTAPDGESDGPAGPIGAAMKNLNTRRWSTPATMGAGTVVVTTGLLMFFVTESPFKFAHELVGIGFSVAVVLHVLTHWRSFTNYFSQRGGVGVLTLAWSVGIGLVLASAILSTGEPEELILERIDDTPVALLAPAVGMDLVEFVDRLGEEGVVVDDPGMSIRQLADRYRAEADDLLVSVLR